MSESLPLTIIRSISMLKSLQIVANGLPNVNYFNHQKTICCPLILGNDRKVSSTLKINMRILKCIYRLITKQFWGILISVGDTKRSRWDLEVSNRRCSANAPYSRMRTVFSYGGHTWDTRKSMPVPSIGSSNPRVSAARSLEGSAAELTKIEGAA